MAYYDTVRNPSAFAKMASAERTNNFDALYQSNGWQGAVSRWGRDHLFASRVICREPTTRLAIFVDGRLYPKDVHGLHPCIDHLIVGPDANFADLWEHQLVQQYKPDSLGYVWAALAPFSRAAERPRRETGPPSRHEDSVLSSTRPDPADASASSIGIAQNLSAPLLEDATMRLANWFIRCVVNYAQDLTKTRPFVVFRDERQIYNYTTLPTGRSVEAIDDGGLQLYSGREMVQVAVLEWKRTSQALVDGQPTVSDQVLAQMVGAALALKRDHRRAKASNHNFITILAIAHYVKFFHFHITDNFIEEYETLPTTHNECHLPADSTGWFDAMVPGHRKEIVSNLVALVAWADNEHGQTVDMDMEE